MVNSLLQSTCYSDKTATKTQIKLRHYLVWEELDSDAMFVKSVFEKQHVFSVAGVVLDHSDHLTLLENFLHLPLQD